MSDLAFRRHILVQTLIVVDFLLSLTPKAKRKLESLGNKSVLYGYTLEEEDVSLSFPPRANSGLCTDFVYRQNGQIV